MRGWHVSRSQALDSAAVEAVRARVAGGVALTTPPALGLCHAFSSPAFPVAEHGLLTLAVGGLFTAVGLWMVARGARVGEAEYLALVCLTLVAISGYVLTVQSAGSPLALEWAALSGVANAAVFARRRRGAALVALVGLAGMGVTSWQRLGVDDGAVPALFVEVFVTGFVTVAVRALREVAVDALERAGRGEVTDPLTGIANRRGLERRARDVWSAAGRGRRPVSLLVVDVDHFKRVNDTLGHAEGDRVLCEVARVLEAEVRADDVVVRLGGEEFLVLLRADRADAVRVAERIRLAIAQGLAPVTVSVGVADVVPGVHDPLPQSLWQAVDVADRALYQAKHSGRNRVVLAG